MYSYRWIVNTNDATNDAFPQQETLDYNCTIEQSLNIQCCASNGIGDEKCGLTDLHCIRNFIIIIFLNNNYFIFPFSAF